ncbi:AfsR/SARP family transcriptional regulator [Kribbella catacumbae]|uniref:AfsR/SARP family transcriptional regulator n=1 Tax=Kribbella catacumbae TaxID=460086 RepID=UPI000382B7F9|nr:AfsR/SARP family transcriptional regulator [Kribbella catacumbae]
MTIRFALLGPLRVEAAGRPVRIRAAKQRALLAALLSSANRVVPAEELIDRLWAGSEPSDARGALQIHLSRLRTALGDSAPIRTEQDGYLIEVAVGELDILDFRDRMSRARSAGDIASEAELVRAALSLWKGRPLADIASDSLQRDIVPQLEEEWFQALHRRFDVEQALGNHQDIVGDLRNLVTQYPTRERFSVQLMLALYHCGQQVEALEVYRKVEETLREELGLDVGAELSELHQRVLSHSISPVFAPAVRDAPAAWPTPYQLPADTVDFVGREEPLKHLTGLFAETSPAVRIAAISGMPGVGKSAFAVHLAQRLRPQFPDGQLYVQLHGSIEDRLADVLASCGVPRSTIPDGLDQRSAALRAALADRRVLLLLDDATSTEQVRPFLPGTPSAAVVVTSRSLLAGLAGAHQVRLDPFDDDEAVELLGRMTDPDWIAEQRTAVFRINAACGGLPLALRIAGARVLARHPASVESFADRLVERRILSELTIDNLGVRAILEQTYCALDPLAQQAFRRLGPLGMTSVPSWAADAMFGDLADEHPFDLLVQANLLTSTGLDRLGVPRYRLSPLPAAFAAELAADDEETGPAIARYHQAQLGLAELAFGDRMAAMGLAVSESVARRVREDSLGWVITEKEQLAATILRCFRGGEYEVAARLSDLIMPVLTEHVDNRDQQAC